MNKNLIPFLLLSIKVEKQAAQDLKTALFFFHINTHCLQCPTADHTKGQILLFLLFFSCKIELHCPKMY